MKDKTTFNNNNLYSHQVSEPCSSEEIVDHLTVNGENKTGFFSQLSEKQKLMLILLITIPAAVSIFGGQGRDQQLITLSTTSGMWIYFFSMCTLFAKKTDAWKRICIRIAILYCSSIAIFCAAKFLLPQNFDLRIFNYAITIGIFILGPLYVAVSLKDIFRAAAERVKASQ